MTRELYDWGKELNNLGAGRIPFLCYVDFEMQKPVVIPLNQVDENQILYHFAGRTNCGEIYDGNVATQFSKSPISFEVYQQRYNSVMDHLHYGNSFLVNLTFPTPITTNLSLKDLFFRARQPYKLYVKNRFTVFSPEKFVRIKENEIHSFPMKGTIDAHLPNAENTVLQNAKEKAEHATITDLIRNDLSLVAENVEVVKYRYIDKISTNQKDLLQVSTHIKGCIGENWQDKIGDILVKLLPAGSVSGAPKPKTLEIIKEAELDTRGYYSGIMGIFDGNTFESAVMIRFVEQKNDQLIFRSGGGITAQSNAEEEYQEMVDKVYFPWKDSEIKKP